MIIVTAEDLRDMYGAIARMPQVLTYAHAHATARAIAAAVVSTQKSLKIKTGLSNC